MYFLTHHFFIHTLLFHAYITFSFTHYFFIPTVQLFIAPAWSETALAWFIHQCISYSSANNSLPLVENSLPKVKNSLPIVNSWFIHQCISLFISKEFVTISKEFVTISKCMIHSSMNFLFISKDKGLGIVESFRVLG